MMARVALIVVGVANAVTAFGIGLYMVENGLTFEVGTLFLLCCTAVFLAGIAIESLAELEPDHLADEVTDTRTLGLVRAIHNRGVEQ
jgi:hypothetical protein